MTTEYEGNGVWNMKYGNNTKRYHIGKDGNVKTLYDEVFFFSNDWIYLWRNTKRIVL